MYLSGNSLCNLLYVLQRCLLYSSLIFSYFISKCSITSHLLEFFKICFLLIVPRNGNELPSFHVSLSYYILHIVWYFLPFLLSFFNWIHCCFPYTICALLKELVPIVLTFVSSCLCRVLMSRKAISQHKTIKEHLRLEKLISQTAWYIQLQFQCINEFVCYDG